MINKCPKCGYIFNDGDKFCSKCGLKLSFDVLEENSIESHFFPEDKVEQKDGFIKRILQKVFKNNNDPAVSYTIFNKNASFDGILINVVLCMIIIFGAFAVFMLNITSKQDLNKESLQFNNYIQNPERIPQFREPKTFDEFALNITNIENFLELFIKYSKESEEKNEQIFISYLNEMEKLPHVNSDITESEQKICTDIKTKLQARNCASRLNKIFTNTGVSAKYQNKTVYLYPNYEYIKKRYSEYFSKDIQDYLSLRAKYNYPVASGLILNLSPNDLAKKILDYEFLFNQSDNSFVKDSLEEILYSDFREFVFNPYIYASTTHEITSEFKQAYKYFIKHKNSSLTPVVASCLEKGKAYSEENFKKDYPYKIYTDTFETNVESSNFIDIFSQLRKTIVQNDSDANFTYVFSLSSNSWKKYNSSIELKQGDYILGEPDTNNKIKIYNNTFSLVDEVSIHKYSRLFMVSNQLYIFNSDRLQISKIFFNGRNFNVRVLSGTDVASIFPGIEVINIDSYSNYNIYIEKPNKSANYIILSRYSQGYENYSLSGVKGKYSELNLPIMFNVNSQDDTIVAFHNNSIDPDRTSENSPTYKFIIHTIGQPQTTDNNSSDIYDEQTAKDSANSEVHTPNIIPKLEKNEDSKKKEKDIDESLLVSPPSILIEDVKNEDDE